MKKERIKKIIKSHEPEKIPDAYFIMKLLLLQLEYAGTYCDISDYMKNYEAIHRNTTITQEQALRFKAKVFELLITDYDYILPKCESEFGYFLAHHGLKVKG